MGDIFTQRAPILFQTLADHELRITHTRSEKLQRQFSATSGIYKQDQKLAGCPVTEVL